MSSTSSKNERKKPKLVRDSFTIPKNEYVAIDALKGRGIALGHSVKKSELLRAGLLALQAMSDSQFKSAIGAVPQLKTGRPAAESAAAEAAAPAVPLPSPAARKASVPAAKPGAAAKEPARKAAPKAEAVTKPAAAASERPAAATSRRRPKATS